MYLLDMAAEMHCIMNVEDGIKVYKKILDIAPDYIPAHFHLADCYAYTHNDKLAIKEYNYVRENAPDLAPELEWILADFDIKIDNETRV